MENHLFYINELINVLGREEKFQTIVERLKLLIGLNKKDVTTGLELLINDCISKDVPSDNPSLHLLKHVYRKITS